MTNDPNRTVDRVSCTVGNLAAVITNVYCRLFTFSHNMAEMEIPKIAMETALASWYIHTYSIPPPPTDFDSNPKSPGTDLYGNTFWYFKPSFASLQPRRILQNNPKIAYSDIQISPQWHQWLRHTRPSPPSLQEQQTDVVRQQQLKRLAQAADERWAAKPSVLDKPRRGNMALGVGDGEAEGTVGRRWEPGEETAPGETAEEKKGEKRKKEKENPWKRDQGKAEYQPEAWTPGPSKR